MKIVIQINGADIELTPEDARRIYNELAAVFTEEKPVYVPTPYPVYPLPLPAYPPSYPFWTYEIGTTISSPNTATVPSVWAN